MIPRLELAGGYGISRLVKGGWHLAGGHGEVDAGRAVRDMAGFVDAGITTFDCADIYTGVEELIGRFRREFPEHARRVRVHTKFVPDLDDLGRVDARYVEAIVDRSLARLGMERLDLVQFHWWDYAVPRYVEVALQLERLRRAGKIDRIGLTNFGTPQVRELLDAGVPVFAHQLQYSLLDDRPAHGMAQLCAERGIALLCYGTVAGGFLSERWLGAPAPPPPLANRSLTKYRLIIDEFGGWAPFQELLRVLHAIAGRHDCDIATVATRVVLDLPGVAAAIVGATSTAHLAAHLRIGELALTAADRAAIAAATAGRRGPPGDVYELERDREGPHGRIMKYGLNK
ncbi:MAG: aldo/keto reductase [Steroidobacteraceae bacterium]|jgi:aryl-alcohol dehydrogenase-like predicted oxidoreductase|nr:aldo/keto reductase [Steroidobacteraceae bacterium]